MPRAKKSRPTFDVARTEIAGVRAGWVYRSDAAPVETAPIVESVAAPPTAPTPIISQPAATPRPEPAPAAPERTTTPTWIASGIGMMVFPFSLAVAIVAAPAIWMLSPRK